LWGDPTLKLPLPADRGDGLFTVQHEVHGNMIIVQQPVQAYDKVVSEKYQTQMLPNARLAGLLHTDPVSAERSLVTLLFAEVHLTGAPTGKVPRLTSRVPEDRWVFCWDRRRRYAYLLVTPRLRDRGDLRFHVEWVPDEGPNG